MYKPSDKIIRSTKYRFILLSNVIFRFQIGQPLVELRTEKNDLVSSPAMQLCCYIVTSDFWLYSHFCSVLSHRYTSEAGWNIEG